MQLLETLETQHRAMAEHVAAIEAAIGRKDAAAIAEPLGKLRHLLTQHFLLEQTHFYPPLRAATAGQPGLGQVVEAFAQNMQVISDGLIAFFRRFKQPELDLATFTPEWRKSLGILQQRLRDEEKTLHPIYAKAVSADAKTG